MFVPIIKKEKKNYEEGEKNVMNDELPSKILSTHQYNMVQERIKCMVPILYSLQYDVCVIIKKQKKSFIYRTSLRPI